MACRVTLPEWAVALSSPQCTEPSQCPYFGKIAAHEKLIQASYYMAPRSGSVATPAHARGARYSGRTRGRRSGGNATLPLLNNSPHPNVSKMGNSTLGGIRILQRQPPIPCPGTPGGGRNSLLLTQPAPKPPTNLLGHLTHAPPSFRRLGARKQVRLDNLGQNFQPVDDAWTRPVEVRGAVHGIHAA